MPEIPLHYTATQLGCSSIEARVGNNILDLLMSLAQTTTSKIKMFLLTFANSRKIYQLKSLIYKNIVFCRRPFGSSRNFEPLRILHLDLDSLFHSSWQVLLRRHRIGWDASVSYYPGYTRSRICQRLVLTVRFGFCHAER